MPSSRRVLPRPDETEPNERLPTQVKLGRITLLDVLHAVELKPSIGVHTPNLECPLGAVLGEPRQAVLDEAEGCAFRSIVNAQFGHREHIFRDREHRFRPS